MSGLVAVNVNAADNVGVSRVELKANGTVVATDSSAPYAFSWNSAGVANGMNNLVAVAYDAAGNTGTSSTVAVNVANATVTSPTPTPTTGDTAAPVITVSNPVAGSVSGRVEVSVSAADNSGAAGVTMNLHINTVLRAYGSGGNLAYSWDTTKSSGNQTLKIVARDKAGNVATKYVYVTIVK